MDPERLSSRATPIAKFVFPTAFLAGLGAASISLWFGEWTSSPLVLRLSFPAAFLLALGYFAKYSFPLKKVILYGSELIISNYITAESVPLTHVAEVSEHPYIREHPITLRFSSANRFGKEILFIPRIRWFFFGSHPVANLLRHAVRNSREPSRAA